MKKFFISPLFCLALVLALPLPMYLKADASSSDEYAKCGCNANKPSRDHELVRFIGRLSALDEDESSPLHALNELVKEGEFVVSKDDFVAALDHAQLVIIDNNEQISDEEIEQMSNTFNALVDVVTQSDSATRDCGSACDDDSALKIRKILSVLNKAIFCDVVVFRNEAVFCKHVEMQDSLNVRKLRAHKAKIDALEAKKGKFKKLKAKKARIDALTAEEITTVDLTVTGVANIPNIVVESTTVCDLTVTCQASVEALEVVTSATIDCDLTVGCNIFMSNSISPAVGNIYKSGSPFMHNFGINNTFVGNSAGNFGMSGVDNSGFGTGALASNTTGTINTALGAQALLNNTTGSNNTASGFQALQANTTGSFNTASGQGALFANTTGDFNVAVGQGALQNNTIADNNTAVGFEALLLNTTGQQNTATGSVALAFNTTGGGNTANGQGALQFNTTGNNNTASGVAALGANTTGGNNTANGVSALLNNTIGDNNTAFGMNALQASTTASNNTAVGQAALFANTTGSNNIAVGSSAGLALAGAESDNIYIGHVGILGESAAIRIGTVGTQTTTFMAGINPNVSGSPVTVTVDTVTGQLGIIPSSIRYKENVEDMKDASSAILELRPVTFNYKVDPTHAQQFGLIAEEVYQVIPALVVKDGNGQIETIKYHELASLLLNELIKLQARVALLEEQVSY